MASFKKTVGSLPFRIAFGIVIPLLIIAGLLFRYYVGNPMICIFYELTHLYCPGCGSGRALLALLRLDIGGALSYNFFFVIFLLPIGYYLLKLYLKVVLRRDLLPFPRLNGAAGYVVIFLLFLFGILRNIPLYPFTLLAP